MTKPYLPAEDTYLLVDAIGGLDGVERAAEVGSSIGYSTAALADRADEVFATDIDIQALLEARDRLTPQYERIHLIEADGLTIFREEPYFDLVASNPPYLPSTDFPDPTVDGGPTGLEKSLSILAMAAKRLRPHGRILIVGSSLSNYNRLFLAARKLGLELVGRLYKRLFFEELVCLILKRGVQKA